MFESEHSAASAFFEESRRAARHARMARGDGGCCRIETGDAGRRRPARCFADDWGSVLRNATTSSIDTRTASNPAEVVEELETSTTSIWVCSRAHDGVRKTARRRLEWSLARDVYSSLIAHPRHTRKQICDAGYSPRGSVLSQMGVGRHRWLPSTAGEIAIRKRRSACCVPNGEAKARYHAATDSRACIR